MLFADDDADPESRQPVQQLVWASRLFNECPVQVFYYTLPDDDELEYMRAKGGREIE